MHIPDWFHNINSVEDFETLSPLPRAEDGQHEYKASRTGDGELANKLGVAASAFWNAGGGLFVCGVDGAGNFDGGRPLTVGRQPLQDWADQALMNVNPPGPYQIRVIEAARQPTHGLLLVAFQESHVAPHMAPDHRYYIRAGAHSVPAGAFLVDALIARRQLSRPLLRHVLRVNPHHGRAVQLGLVTASNQHALNVELELPPLPLTGKDPSVFKIAVIGPDTPFFLDFTFLMLERSHAAFDGRVTYYDAANRKYEHTFTVDVETQLGPPSLDQTTERLIRAIKDISQNLSELRHAIPGSKSARR
jgi:hypothetical protein